MASASSSPKEVATEILPYIRVYKDGTVERLLGSPNVPPSPDGDPETGVSSKDITISVLNYTSFPARIYLPDLSQNQNQKLPVLIYFHGGGFCIESSFSFFTHRYLSRLVYEAKVVAVSVEYRLAPENPLPAAYDDCWVALRWAASHSTDTQGFKKELWLTNHGDFGRLYIGGDSSGANIAHDIAIRAGNESLPGGVKLLGAFLGVPYFLGSKPIGSEPIEGFEKSFSYVIWNFVYPSAPGGVDNPKLNTLVAGAPSLAGLGCSRLLVVVAENDELRDRGVWYCNGVRESGWEGELEVFETEGAHTSHILEIDTEIAKTVIKRIASFLV
ncbi:hypothetical protein FNV43_RR01829 [Rhamnella rubrinervis]|uniref:Alpha/beta hydrolase fold-3 domain-containing protein n=1 Tax=Rhamnella rubrinervis TaxID=2594499 RepID=A0A8K0HQB9_9ROSA|nr:hypothetical protein FNV43_RR01829 [Rhamnella rubrinervis]